MKTRRTHARVALGAALAAMLMLTACGDGGTTESTTEVTAEETTDSPAEETPQSADGNGDGGLLVAIYKSGTQEYFLDQAAGFKERAEELGFDAETFDVELNANLAINTLNDAIAQGAVGIAITVPDQAIGPSVAQAAAQAGIPLVATDDAISDDAGQAVPFVGFNGTDMGTSVGTAAAELLNENGWLEDDSINLGLLSVEVETLSVCNDRTDASKDVLRDAGVTDDQIFSVLYSGEADGAFQAAGPVITAHPDVTRWVVFACNDEGVLGTLNALDNAGIAAEDIVGVGLGAYEACKPWAEGLDTGFKAALYISGTDVGAAAAEVLAAAVNEGAELPAETIADTTIVTPENYEEVMGGC